MIYVIMILICFWNAWSIRDEKRDTVKASRKWHRYGWWVSAGVLMVGLVGFLPEWYWYVINPAGLLGGLWGGLLTFSLLVWMRKYLFNMVINHINGWQWDYLERGKFMQKGHKIAMYVFAGMIVSWLIFGGMLSNVLLRYF